MQNVRFRGPFPRRPRGDSERGAAAVEFAIVVPLLLLVVFAVVNFGIVMVQKATISNSARSAARYAVVNAYGTAHTCKSVIDKARDGATTLGISDASKTDVKVTVTLTNASTAAESTVCTAAAGAASPAVSTSPCTGGSASPATPDTLTVKLEYSTKLLVNTPGLGKTVPLTSSSSFICEYYS